MTVHVSHTARPVYARLLVVHSLHCRRCLVVLIPVDTNTVCVPIAAMFTARGIGLSHITRRGGSAYELAINNASVVVTNAIALFSATEI